MLEMTVQYRQHPYAIVSVDALSLSRSPAQDFELIVRSLRRVRTSAKVPVSVLGRVAGEKMPELRLFKFQVPIFSLDIW